MANPDGPRRVIRFTPFAVGALWGIAMAGALLAGLVELAAGWVAGFAVWLTLSSRD